MMTKTAHQLIWDKEFVEKRINEQKSELLNVMERFSNKKIDLERAKRLNDSINPVLRRFEVQLENINKLK